MTNEKNAHFGLELWIVRVFQAVTRQIIVTKRSQQKDRRSMNRRTFNRKQYFDSYLRVLRVLRGIYVWGVGGEAPD